MSYLLDTNVLSELVRPKPNAGVVAWFASTPDESLHISVLTLGELRQGVETMSVGRRRERLRVWLESELPDWFGPRVLPINAVVADRGGRLVAQAKRPVPAIDSLTAAVALVFDLRVVTRNVRDFALPGVEVVDPWNVQDLS
jgi:toxin FitB